jgi:hypothetical protein
MPQQNAVGGRRRVLVGLVAAAIAAAVAAGVAVLLLAGSPGPSYASQARNALTPVLQANNQLTGMLDSLASGAATSGAKASLARTTLAVQAAQRTLGALKPGSGDGQSASDVQAALTSELVWANAGTSVLDSSNSPMLSHLESLAVDTQTKLAAINALVPGASASFPGSSALLVYAQKQAAQKQAAQKQAARKQAAQKQHAATQSSLTQFSGQVQEQLAQSTPAFQQINELFGQLQTAASGGSPDISLAQAEATISNVISNRNSLAAAAGALTAPTPLAVSVRDALVAAYDASLTDDQDIETCLNQDNNGTVALIFQDCLTSTASDNDAATAAKQHFWTLYNQLRAQIGQPQTTQQF